MSNRKTLTNNRKMRRKEMNNIKENTNKSTSKMKMWNLWTKNQMTMNKIDSLLLKMQKEDHQLVELAWITRTTTSYK